jgi:hypothetical protein
MADKQAEVTATIAADPEALYDLVSDLTQMGKWSPEASGGKWIGGASGPSLGASFRGDNKSGWRRWSTVAKVTAADRGKRFAFHITVGPIAVADWSYDFEPTASGTLVTERWVDRRATAFELFSRPMMGIYDRATHNRKNMEQTLAALKAAAEDGSTQTAS